MKSLTNRETFNFKRAGARLRLIFQSLLLTTVVSDVYAASCPPSCKCRFSDVLEENISTCESGNSIVNITWRISPGLFSWSVRQNVLAVTCQGDNFTCADLPQFDITDNYGNVSVTSCAPRIMRCVHGIYRQLPTILSVALLNLTGPYTVEDFRNFDKLRELSIGLTDTDKELPVAVINSLKSLTSLAVRGGDFWLRSNMFDMPNIGYLQLETDNIKNIPADAFNGLSDLVGLSITVNHVEEVNVAAFRGLNNLFSLNLLGFRGKSMDSNIFLQIKKINYIYFENIQLEHFKNGVLERLYSLRQMTIRTNHEAMTLGSEAFARLQAPLENIVLQNCKISTLPVTLFKDSNHLLGISFEDNMIEVLPAKTFSDAYSVVTISLRNNKIKILESEVFSKAKELATVELSYNHIETLSGGLFAANYKLKDVYLDHNKISRVDLNVFNQTNLREVNLSANKLQRIIGQKVTWETNKLNLSDNALTTFEDWFVKLKNLGHLDLTHNEIKKIKASQINSFTSRAIVDLRYNKISHVEHDISNKKSLASHEKFTLYLSNNPFECDCVTITVLRDWNKHGLLADYEEIVCVDEHKLSNISNDELILICNKKHALIGRLGPSLIIAFIIILFIILIYARRKKLRAYIFNLFNRNTDNMTAYEMQLDMLKKYDLFISFAHQDGDFVVDELLPKLENDFGQKVCVHYREWLVGDLIPDQIIQSVESSRKTIIILTEHFLESEWSYLEFRTAHNLSLQEGKQRVIIILLNAVLLQNEMSDDIKSYIDTYTYLLWGDPNFWEKLQKVLPRQGTMFQKSVSKNNILNSLKCNF